MRFLPKIKVSSHSFSKNKKLQELLLKQFPNTIFNETGQILQGSNLFHFIQDADGIIAGQENLNSSILNKTSKLKVISKYGVGLDNINFEYCKKQNIQVKWTAGVNKRSVAELTLSFMLTLCKNFYPTSIQLKNGVWNKTGGIDLSQKTIGIIGVGNIGKELIELLKPFRCKILVNDILDQSNYYKKHQLFSTLKEKILKESDIVTIHTPLTQQTTNLINLNSIQLMKKSAFLINTARGPIVNQNALKKALLNQWIAGAALDVYSTEPPTDKKFLNIPNLICSPHIGGNSQESVFAMGTAAIQNLKNFFINYKPK